ncbi:MAG: hypothetical protein ACE5KE_00700 [Methanosarcinales archaeon]
MRFQWKIIVGREVYFKNKGSVIDFQDDIEENVIFYDIVRDLKVGETAKVIVRRIR